MGTCTHSLPLLSLPVIQGGWQNNQNRRLSILEMKKCPTRPHTSCSGPDEMRVPSTGQHTEPANLQANILNLKHKYFCFPIYFQANILTSNTDIDHNVPSVGNANSRGDPVVWEPWSRLHCRGCFCLSGDWTVHTSYCRHASPGNLFIFCPF